MRRNKTIVKFLIILLGFGSLVFFVAPVSAAGASLYLAPSKGTYTIGGKFNVAVKVNSGGADINAAEGKISFDAKLLEVTSVSKSGSIFPFWTTEPNFSNSAGTVSFGGGMPPPPYKGTAGQICTISFRAKAAGTATLRFTTGAVLANDGKGTNVIASMGSASFIINPKTEASATTGNDKKPEVIKEPAEPVETEYNKPVIESPSHPDQNTWYNKNTVDFKWSLPQGVTDISISFDENPVGNPGSESDGLLAQKSYEKAADGVHYLHLKFKDPKKWGTVAHYRVMVDTTPPEPFEIRVNQIQVGEWPELQFETKDAQSGLKKYDLFIGSLEQQAHELQPQDKSYKVSDLEVGEHTAIVKAIDAAGNERDVTVHFTIAPIDAPVIVNYSQEIKSADRFYVNGTAMPDVEITLFISDGKGNIVQGKAQSDANGKWSYFHADSLENGHYTAWAEAKNKNGIKSGQSQKISFLVSPPVFAVIGSFVINYFTMFISLLSMIVLIIICVIYIIGLLRKRLKKETLEIEDILESNAEAMKGTIDAEFEALSKFEGRVAYKKEKEAMKERLKSQVDETTKKSIKEVKDVENILR
jgi:hypothetical protein